MGLFACLPYSKNEASKVHEAAKQYKPGARHGLSRFTYKMENFWC